MNDILINKIQSIQRSIRRAREEYSAGPNTFVTNYTRQDAAILNILRACDSTIDLANHLVRIHKLGIPVSSADSFRLLSAEGLITPLLATQMKKLIGFWNFAVHQYTKIDLEVVASVITKDLDRLLEFTDIVGIHIEPIQ